MSFKTVLFGRCKNVSSQDAVFPSCKTSFSKKSVMRFSLNLMGFVVRVMADSSIAIPAEKPSKPDLCMGGTCHAPVCGKGHLIRVG